MSSGLNSQQAPASARSMARLLRPTSLRLLPSSLVSGRHSWTHLDCITARFIFPESLTQGTSTCHKIYTLTRHLLTINSVPYIADAMHNETDTTYYNIESILFYDPSTSYSVVQDDIPTVPFVEYWDPLFSLNATYMDDLRNRADKCGYTAFMEEAMTFPPNGPLPTPPNVNGNKANCDLWSEVVNYAAPAVNPCWDVYQVATTCPNLWDVLGFPGSFTYEPAPWSEYRHTRALAETRTN